MKNVILEKDGSEDFQNSNVNIINAVNNDLFFFLFFLWENNYQLNMLEAEVDSW